MPSRLGGEEPRGGLQGVSPALGLLPGRSMQHSRFRLFAGTGLSVWDSYFYKEDGLKMLTEM